MAHWRVSFSDEGWRDYLELRSSTKPWTWPLGVKRSGVQISTPQPEPTNHEFACQVRAGAAALWARVQIEWISSLNLS